MKKIYLILAILSIILLSCSEENGTNPDKEPDPKKYDIPDTYNFDNVDLSRQLTQFEMIDEIKKTIIDAIENKVSINARVLNRMYYNIGTPFNNPNLNASEESLYTVTDPLRTSFFEFYIADINNASTTGTAANNKKGILTSNDNSQTILVDSVGKEYLVMIEKGLMGALFFYQVAQVYTSEAKIGKDVDNKEVIEGKGTQMQYNWDQAFGYFGATIEFPISNSNIRYVAKLSDELDAFLNTNSLLMKEGFIKGRAAINNDDSKGKNEAIASIRKNWELVLAATAIRHLTEAKKNFEDKALKHHNLTSAWILLWSIQYNPQSNGYFYENAQAEIGTNFWNTTIDGIDKAIDILVNAYNLQEVKNAS